MHSHTGCLEYGPACCCLVWWAVPSLPPVQSRAAGTMAKAPERERSWQL